MVNPEKHKKSFSETNLTVFSISRGEGYYQTGTLQLLEIADRLGRYANFVDGTSSGIHVARTAAHEICKREMRKMGYDDKVIRGLWLDTDIRFLDDQIDAIVEEIKKADEEGYSFAVPYYVAPDKTSVSNSPLGLKMLTRKELDNLPEYSKLTAAGFGFWYGDIYLDYRFHYDMHDGKWNGEDINYFIENPVDLRLVKKIELFHKKYVWYGLNRHLEGV